MLKFALQGSPGDVSPVRITGPVEVIDETFSECAYELIDGSVTIKSLALIDGVVTHHGQPMPQVTVNADGVNVALSTLTNNEGFYSHNIAAGVLQSLSATKATDASTYLDYLNAADLARMQRHLLQVELLTNPFELIAADVNESKSISLLDKILIERVILGMGEFANQSQWKFVPSNFQFNSTDVFSYPSIIEITTFDDLKQDFTAIHLGDIVNSNTTDARSHVESYVLEMSREKDESVAELRIAVRGYNFTNVSAMQASFVIDSSLEYKGIEEGFIKPTASIANNNIRLVWDDALGKSQTFADGTVLFTFKFSNIDSDEAKQIENMFTFSSTLKPQAYSNTLAGGDLTMRWAQPETKAYTTGELYPNPFEEFINVTIGMEEAGEVLLKVLDVNGKTVYQTVFKGKKGLNTFMWRGDDRKGYPVEKGMYFLEIHAGTFIKSMKAIRN